MPHIPVLLKEAVDSLDLQAGDVFLDGTLGGGGHSKEVVERLSSSVTIIGLDRDSGAVERSRERLGEMGGKTILKVASFRHLDQVLEELGISEVNAILLDLGISSDQLDTSGRGFSFQREEPLDMRMSEEGVTAAEIVNEFDEGALELIIRGFGEEHHSRQIARAIVARREVTPLATTWDLAEVIRSAVPKAYERGRINPATRTFQAIRIAVNDELDALEDGLRQGFHHLADNGRFSVISFHSLEDRVVKNFFRQRAGADEAKLITKRPITASETEINSNPRARSAKLRTLEKIPFTTT